MSDTQNLPLAALADRIKAEHVACQNALRTGVAHAIECGRLLIEAKAKVSHGEWLPWLLENVPFSERSARGYMRLYRELPKLDEPNRQRIADMSLSEALRELADHHSPKPETGKVPVTIDGEYQILSPSPSQEQSAGGSKMQPPDTVPTLKGLGINTGVSQPLCSQSPPVRQGASEPVSQLPETSLCRAIGFDSEAGATGRPEPSPTLSETSFTAALEDIQEAWKAAPREARVEFIKWLRAHDWI